MHSRLYPRLADRVCIADVPGQRPVKRLPQPVIKKRIDAARTLRGWRQVDLQEHLHAYGLGKVEAGRLERGDITITQAHVDALCRVLRVPERWFTVEDHDIVVGYHAPGVPAITDSQVREAAALLGPQLLAAAQAVRQERELERPETDAQDHPSGAKEGGGG